MNKTQGANCPVCDCERFYRSAQGRVQGEIKPRRSCANSIRLGGSGSVKVKNGKKICFRCKTEKDVDDFYFHPSKQRHHSLCNPCKAESFRVMSRNNFRKWRYGMTLEAYDAQVESQDGRCYICREQSGSLYVDHDHATGKVRKLLCHNCNACLGLARENPVILNNMIKYLEQFDGR